MLALERARTAYPWARDMFLELEARVEERSYEEADAFAAWCCGRLAVSAHQVILDYLAVLRRLQSIDAAAHS